VIPEIAEGSPEENSDCDLDCIGIAARGAATNTRSIARRIFVSAGSLPDWPTRRSARPARQANKKCDSAIHLDDRIVSPSIGIADLRHGMRRQRTVASLATPKEMVSERRPPGMVTFAHNRKLSASGLAAAQAGAGSIDDIKR
jgi:hypothetical protein